VHGFSNFYIAGSSVFPTAGANFPTITLTALALRLADHIVKQLKSAHSMPVDESLLAKSNEYLEDTVIAAAVNAGSLPAT
jgi:choline dehydrogenase-like flavoprotein